MEIEEEMTLVADEISDALSDGRFHLSPYQLLVTLTELMNEKLPNRLSRKYFNNGFIMESLQEIIGEEDKKSKRVQRAYEILGLLDDLKSARTKYK